MHILKNQLCNLSAADAAFIFDMPNPYARRCLQVYQKSTEPLCPLGRVGIGNQHAIFSNCPVGNEVLRAIDDIMIPFPDCRCLRRSCVRACVRLGQGKTPNGVPSKQPWHAALLLLLAAKQLNPRGKRGGNRIRNAKGGIYLAQLFHHQDK